MFIGLSFVGILPSYIIECCQQIRYYFEDEVFLITNDINSLYINELKQYNINIIEYNI